MSDSSSSASTSREVLELSYGTPIVRTKFRFAMVWASRAVIFGMLTYAVYVTVRHERIVAAARAEAAEENLDRQTVSRLVRLARQAAYERQFRAADRIISEVLVLDPTNEYAVGVQGLVRDYALVQEKRQKLRDAERAAHSGTKHSMDTAGRGFEWPSIEELVDE